MLQFSMCLGFGKECVFFLSLNVCVFNLPILSCSKVVTPRMDMTLAELQEMAARQQQQIEAQQQLLASKVCNVEVQDESQDW